MISYFNLHKFIFQLRPKWRRSLTCIQVQNHIIVTVVKLVHHSCIAPLLHRIGFLRQQQHQVCVSYLFVRCIFTFVNISFACIERSFKPTWPTKPCELFSSLVVRRPSSSMPLSSHLKLLGKFNQTWSQSVLEYI